jgi:pyruvate formate-lyase/glycerol dehydratase family glycyl radical enzyme
MVQATEKQSAKEFKTWEPSDALSPRVKKLRDEYFDYDNRDYFRNEAIPYTTGKPWDAVFVRHHWTTVPEENDYLKPITESLLALAQKVDLPSDFWDEPLVVRKALFLQQVLKVIPVQILEGELIVGGQFNTAFSLCLNQNEAAEWKKKEDELVEKEIHLCRLGVMNCGSIPGHIIPNYPRVLREGFMSIKKESEEFLKTKANTQEKKDFARAILICCDAVRDFTNRYVAEARKLAKVEKEPQRREELERIADICEKVPWNPAQSFHEALQSLWFTHMLFMLAESYPGPGLSHGRIDQYLYPYYENDINSGKLTRADAKELLECWMIKHNYAYDFARVGEKGISAGFGQLMTLGGQGPKGEDVTNDLTYLFIDAIEELDMLEPKRSVRIHKNTPDDFLLRLCESIQKCHGSPFLMNFDGIVLSALVKEGIDPKEAWDYGVVGCLENTAQYGRDRSGTVDVNPDLAKAVELALNDGKDMATGEQIGPKTGDPTKFKTFSEFMNAAKGQIKSILKQTIDIASAFDTLRGQFEPIPYCSSLMQACLEKGKDVRQGGTIYNFITVEGVGFATLADSVTAIKKLVYDDKKVPMKDLVETIKKDFIGNERLRQMLVNEAPKYGNDDDYADSIARELSRFWAEEVAKRTSPVTGRKFRAGYLSWNYYIDNGPKLASTPDGRKRGRFLSNGVQPVQGRDMKGPTAAFKSVCKLGYDVVPNGASYVVTLSPASLRDDEHLRKFAAMLRAYEKLGGTSMQVNLIDAETLKDAQKHPENYQNLLVRVTGYNAYFVMLGKEMQDEIIARTAHQL